jgi:hypothetical protein
VTDSGSPTNRNYRHYGMIPFAMASQVDDDRGAARGLIDCSFRDASMSLLQAMERDVLVDNVDESESARPSMSISHCQGGS